MKKLVLLFSVFVLIAFSGCKEAEKKVEVNNGSNKNIESEDVAPVKGVARETVTEDEKEDEDTTDLKKIFKIKSGIITYQLSGTENGTQTFYFDDYGHLGASYMNTDQQKNGLVLELDDLLYQIDLDKKTGVKIQNINPYDYIDENGNLDWSNFSGGSLSGLVPEQGGTAEIAGETCDMFLFKTYNFTMCIWNNLMLLSDFSMYGTTTHREAIKIEQNVDIPREKFEIPEGITLTEGFNVKNFVNSAK